MHELSSTYGNRSDLHIQIRRLSPQTIYKNWHFQHRIEAWRDSSGDIVVGFRVVRLEVPCLTDATVQSIAREA